MLQMMPPPLSFFFFSSSRPSPVSFGNVASGGVKLGTLFEDKLFYYIDYYFVKYCSRYVHAPINGITNNGINGQMESKLARFISPKFLCHTLQN
jgi:hypothetical protein